MNELEKFELALEQQEAKDDMYFSLFSIPYYYNDEVQDV